MEDYISIEIYDTAECILNPFMFSSENILPLVHFSVKYFSAIASQYDKVFCMPAPMQGCMAMPQGDTWKPLTVSLKGRQQIPGNDNSTQIELKFQNNMKEIYDLNGTEFNNKENCNEINPCEPHLRMVKAGPYVT